ncbi:MAG: pentapeptide repeat-containing protein [Bacteroidetes bacterium]|nr:pentapeptide repeat-containing protein [Bacteroidota bacterium]
MEGDGCQGHHKARGQPVKSICHVAKIPKNGVFIPIQRGQTRSSDYEYHCYQMYPADNHFEDITFTVDTIAANGILPGIYEGCRFEGCDLSSRSLNGLWFIDSTFNNCNLSNANLTGSTWNGVWIRDCQAMGLAFGDCHSALYDVHFEGCRLDYSSFLKSPLRGARYIRCSLLQVDFSGADLREADFSLSILTAALFKDCNLEKCDFREAIDFGIDPSCNRMRDARFAPDALEGLLRKYGLNIR